MALMNYIMGIALSCLDRCICLTDVTEEAIYCVIDNTGRSEEDVESLAKELKVQILMAAKLSLNADIETTVRFKSVPHDVYLQTQRDTVDKYKGTT